MADWTVILTTVGAAGLTGAFGYLGIRRSTDVTKQQMAEETTRAHEQVEAENERLRAQHREDHLRNRQGTYHALIGADQELASVLGHGTGDAQEVFAKFSQFANGAQLFGTKAVADAVTKVVSEYLEVSREAEGRAGDKPVTPADIRTVFEERLERIHAARTELLEAMREDVGP